MAKTKTKFVSPHRLTFRLEDGSLTVSRWAEKDISPKLAKMLWKEGYRQFKGRGQDWRPLQELMMEEYHAEA